MDLRNRIQELLSDTVDALWRGEDRIGLVEQFAQEVRNEALDQVLAAIAREQNYREYRAEQVGDQDGSGIGACKEIAGYVRALKVTK